MAGFTRPILTWQQRIDAYKHAMAEAFANSRHFVAEMDNIVRDRQKKTDDRLAEEVNKTKPKYQMLLEAEFENQIEFDTVTGPMFYFNWAYAHAYATFELYLYKLCELHFDTQKLTTDDIKGNDSIDKFRKYIQKVCGIPTTDLAAEFNKLDDYRMIRNKIVHALSDVLGKSKEQPIEKQHLYKIMKRHGIKVDKSHHFYIDNPKFIMDFNGLAAGLLRKLIERALKAKPS